MREFWSLWPFILFVFGFLVTEYVWGLNGVLVWSGVFVLGIFGAMSRMVHRRNKLKKQKKKGVP